MLAFSLRAYLPLFEVIWPGDCGFSFLSTKPKSDLPATLTFWVRIYLGGELGSLGGVKKS